MTSYLDINGLRKSFGGRAGTYALREVSLAVAEGELLSLLGPSGCGKTTTLRCVAGLERPDTGTIRIRGVPVVDTAGKLFVAPEFRRIGMAFQSYALWPHMRVADNVGYPLRTQGVAREEIRRRTAEVLERVSLADKARRYPRELSGGEQQRVALARAIVARPDVLVLDEPLSNLDAQLRQQTLVWLVSLLRELRITTIYVTHDQSEAFAISDRIAVMNRGVVEQVGPPVDIYEQPATPFVARFVGAANLLHAEVVGGGGGYCEIRLAGGGPVLRARPPAAGGGIPAAGTAVQAVVRPEVIRHHVEAPPDGGIKASVDLRVYTGGGWQYVLAVGDAQVRYLTGPDVDLAPGSTVWLTLEASRLPLVSPFPTAPAAPPTLEVSRP